MSDEDSIDVERVVERSIQLRQQLHSLAPNREVQIVAVTKGFGVEAPRAALAAGFTMLGENYAQELLAKHEQLTDDEKSRVQWHFLGRLQRNKVRSLAPIVSVWQSVDRDELVDEIARRAPNASVMIQLNLSGEAQKGGARFEDCGSLVDHARSLGLKVVGLMGVGSAGAPDASSAAFARLVAMADTLAVPERSIGMSDDLDLGVQAGSTMVRIGSGLFGPRGPKAPI